MYISGDTLILLREEEEVVIAACEGVVGWIKKGDVQFDTHQSQGKGIEMEKEMGQGIPNTIISSPTPPLRNTPLPPVEDVYTGVTEDDDEEERGLEVDHPTPDSRRASGPFDLGTPNHSPGLDKDDTEFFSGQDVPPLPTSENQESLRDLEVGRDEELQRRVRESYRSSASSGLGGIGGFMMGNGGGDDSIRLNTTELKGPSLLIKSGQVLTKRRFTTFDINRDSVRSIVPNNHHCSINLDFKFSN